MRSYIWQGREADMVQAMYCIWTTSPERPRRLVPLQPRFRAAQKLEIMERTREDMIVQNMPLVTFVVGKMSDEGASGAIDREEAIAYGIEGLIQAVDNYDQSRGTTFASFAIRRIRGSILDAGRRMDLLPRSLRKHAREIEKNNLELASMLGRWPTLKELAVRMGMEHYELRSLLGHTNARLVSLEKIMDDRNSEGNAHWEAPDPDELTDPAAQADRNAAFQLLGEALSTLSLRDRRIVQLRYGRAMAFHEIGLHMNLSESRVCQLHKRILTSLQTRLKRDFERAA